MHISNNKVFAFLLADGRKHPDRLRHFSTEKNQFHY